MKPELGQKRSLVPTFRLALLAAVGLVPAAVAAVLRLLGADEDFLGVLLAWDVGILLLAVLDALSGRDWPVEVARQVPPVLSVGRSNPVELELRSRTARPLRVTVHDDGAQDVLVEGLPATVELPPHQTVTLRYHLRPRRRGAHRLEDVWLRTPTRLGLWSRQVVLPAPQDVRVYPDLQAVRQYELLAREAREERFTHAIRRRGGESEFERLRDYTPDDDVRRIDWRATARRGTPIAREFQLERNQHILFALDTGRLMSAESDGLSHVDHALNALLMLAHVSLRAGDQVGLLAFDADTRAFLPPEGGPRGARRLIQASFDLFPSLVETDYRAALAPLRVRLRKRALVILLTQVLDEARREELLPVVRALQPTHLPLVVLFRDASIEALLQPNLADPLDLYTRGPAAAEVQRRERLAEDLRRAGAHVLHVHPRELTQRLLARYLEIKSRQLL